MKLINRVLSLSRPQKRIVSFLCDAIFITVAYFGAFFVRLESFEPIQSIGLWQELIPLIILTVFVFIKLGLYRAILRYLTFQALFVVSVGAILSVIAFYGLRFYISELVPRTVPIIYGVFLALLAGGSRLVMRSFVSSQVNRQRKRVVIYGAGTTGRQLCIALRQTTHYKPVSFIDSDPSLYHTMILGLDVYRPEDLLPMIENGTVDKVLLALPRASRSERKVVIDTLAKYPIKVLTVPDMEDIVSGKAKVDELRDVPIEDLLGRDPVDPVCELMGRDISNKVVMVTGAGGSIGSELCRQILQQRPNKLILFELSEYALYAVERELIGIVEKHGLTVEIIPLLGSVQRKNRLRTVMDTFKVQTVYHAAAYKHVPLVEYNVVEGVRNNIFGTLYTAEAAIEAGVETFVLISTDKAVRPTNVMGTTKRMAELVLQALADTQSHTRFCMVRFGNVLGSSGSVIPLFKKQIRDGGPVTVTHENITRFFMTIPEASQLVIQAGAMGKGGDVFVLDMGESVKISDLARNLIRLSGLEVRDEQNPDGDIEIQYSGLRPGEKLYEELLIGDNVQKTSHERIMTAHEIKLTWQELNSILINLDDACHNFEHEIIRELLLNAPTGFKPTDDICDLVWSMKKQYSM
ncbi:polysaccharide biosynthesis protein [Photobacterium damselae]|uniref:polysaccharide biosynthesis protein n=1 Tax=Photobacterium damselae TaxID=38293 RepID=UPI004068068C